LDVDAWELPSDSSRLRGVRRLPMLALVLLFAGCGSSADPTGLGASSSGRSEPSVTNGPSTAVDEPKLKPPSILLSSDLGKQKAVQGSYCVDYVDEATGCGQAICSDAAPVFPKGVTAVARGDRVTLVVPGAVLKADSIVTVRPLGCSDQEIAQIGFEPGAGELEWDVDRSMQVCPFTTG
jgi:hypothetical protein